MSSEVKAMRQYRQRHHTLKNACLLGGVRGTADQVAVTAVQWVHDTTRAPEAVSQMMHRFSTDPEARAEPSADQARSCTSSAWPLHRGMQSAQARVLWWRFTGSAGCQRSVIPTVTWAEGWGHAQAESGSTRMGR